jgi:colanic acid/amylovoran biosynthesis glycosyltransferase
MNLMKILIFNHSFFNLSETFIYKQVTGLRSRADISLLGFHFNNEKTFPLDNKKYHIRRSVNLLDRLISGTLRKISGRPFEFSIFSHGKVKRLLKQNKFDLIHVHFGFNAVIISPLAKSLGIPLVVTFHGIDASPHQLSDSRYREKVREVLKYASAILIVSPHMHGTLELESFKHKTHLVPCGVDPAEFVNSFPEKQHDTIRLLHSGRLVSKKGVPDLIRVCSRLCRKFPRLRLDIIGDGPELSACQQLVNETGSTQISLLGARTHQEVRESMAQTDIFVLNSRIGDSGDMEGLPVSILEAMSMQLAVVSTLHAGIPLAITDGSDGLLVPEKDNEALETTLEKLILDPGLRQKLGEVARHTVQSRFTIDQMNEKIWRTYQEVVNTSF